MPDNPHDMYEDFIKESWQELESMLDSSLPVPEEPTLSKANFWLRCGMLFGLILLLSIAAYKLIPARTEYVYLGTPISYYPYYSHEASIVDSPASEYIPNIQENVFIRTYKKESFQNINTDNPTEVITTSKFRIDHRSTDKEAFVKVPKLKLAKLSPSLIYENSEENIELKNEKERLQWDLGLIGSMGIENNSTAYGVLSGIEWAINEQVAIVAGLGFNHILNDNTSASNDIASIKEIGGIARPHSEAINSNNQQRLQSYSQILLPLGVRYNVWNNLSFNGGVNFRYTVSSFLENSDLIQKSVTSAHQAISLSNRANLGLMAGLDYNINNSLKLSISTEWGLRSLIYNPSVDPTRSSAYDLNLINVGTSYKF